MAESSPLQVLSAEAQGGRREDFALHLFQEYRDAIFRYLLRKQCSTEDAKDILQETYLRVANSSSLDPLQARARNYIFTVAINIWRDRLRGERTREAFAREQQTGAERVAAAVAESERPALCGRELSAIKQCLQRVGKRPRAVFLLRTIEEYSLVEIAHALGVSTKTAQRDYTSTLELCKDTLQQLRDGPVYD